MPALEPPLVTEDMAEVKGHPEAKKAAEIAALGSSRVEIAASFSNAQSVTFTDSASEGIVNSYANITGDPAGGRPEYQC